MERPVASGYWYAEGRWTVHEAMENIILFGVTKQSGKHLNFMPDLVLGRHGANFSKESIAWSTFFVVDLGGSFNTGRTKVLERSQALREERKFSKKKNVLHALISLPAQHKLYIYMKLNGLKW